MEWMEYIFFLLTGVDNSLKKQQKELKHSVKFMCYRLTVVRLRKIKTGLMHQRTRQVPCSTTESGKRDFLLEIDFRPAILI
jgi:hypothetical protein